MANLELTINLENTDVISGQALNLTAVLRNNGSGEIGYRLSPDWPLTYELRPLTAGRKRFVLSKAGKPGIRRPEAPRLPDMAENLLPGEEKKFKEDPAGYAQEDIGAGTYELIAGFASGAGTVQSQPVQVRIRPAKLSLLDTDFCSFSNAVVATAVHTDNASEHAVLQYEGVDRLTNRFVFQKRAGTSKPIDATSFAVHLEPRQTGRWIAWTSGSEFEALAGYGAGVMAHPGAVSIDLKDARLAQPGFQTAPETQGKLALGPALFFMYGGRNGENYIQPILVDRDGIRKGNLIPIFHHQPGKIFTCYAKQSHGSEIVLVWSESTSAGTRLFAHFFALDGSVLYKQPLLIFEKEAALLALACDPIVAQGKARMHALFSTTEPATGAGQLLFSRIPLTQSYEAPEEFVLLPPREPVVQYAISGRQTGELRILAATGSEILHASAMLDGKWERLCSHAGPTRLLQLAASRQKYWRALWIDPAGTLNTATDTSLAPDG